MDLTFQYFDQRHADTYIVEVIDDEFSQASRYVLGITRDPIIYKYLADIPQPHQYAIEQEINHRI